MSASLDLYLLPGLDGQCLIDTGMAVGDAQVVIAFDLDRTVGGGGPMFLGVQDGDAVAPDGLPSLVANLKSAVVFDLLFHVTLGPQIDQLLTGAVFQVQLVEAVVARRAARTKHGAGLVRRQRVGPSVGAVGQASADQGLVGVAFHEGHQHLHAHPRDRDAPVAVARPIGGDSQPTAAAVVEGPRPIPEKPDLDPAIRVAVDLFALGPGDDCRLAAPYTWFLVNPLRTKDRIPRRGNEVIAIALIEVVFSPASVAGGDFLQHLRLFAFVMHFGQEP
ncbi:hypothetical protein D3C84_759790 [compost metagenome]